jgi:hypothetical protein
LFYPAINFDLKSFRFLTSDYGRQIRKKKESELFPLADYKLYVINNKEAFQTLELQVVGLANYLYDLSRPLKARYSYTRPAANDPWRWIKHRNHTEEEENYSSLKDYLFQNLDKLDRLLESTDKEEVWIDPGGSGYEIEGTSEIMDNRKIVWKYMDWVSNSYLPDNFIGYNRVWLKEFIIFFKKEYEVWKVNSGRMSSNGLSWSTYEKLDLIFENAKKYYRDNHYAIKLRKQDNFDVRLATERSEDAIKLLREIRDLWSASRKGVYGVQPAELNELLFEMGMDDRLPIWDPMVCQKCEGEGFTVHRSKKRRCLKCKGYGYNNPNRIYPIRYQGTYSERELSELNRDAYHPFYRTSDAYGRKSQLEIPQIGEMQSLLNIAESINSREA